MPEIEYINEATDIPAIQMVQVESIAEPTDGFIQFAFLAAGAFFRRHGEAAIRLLMELDLAALTFPVGARIRGRFSGSTQVDRVFFQTDELNTNTSVAALPNGTAPVAVFTAHNKSDPTNASLGGFGSSDAYGAFVNSGRGGTGTILPIGFTITSVLKVMIDTNGYLALNTNAPTAMLDVNSDILRLRVAKTPSSASDAGNQGDFCWDANYFYVCVATDTWKRTALASW